MQIEDLLKDCEVELKSTKGYGRGENQKSWFVVVTKNNSPVNQFRADSLKQAVVKLRQVLA